ncbi:MAG: HD domain-containing phosphohydrolase [Nitrospirota bacterium]
MLGYASIVGFPFKISNHILGVIGIYASKSDAFRNDELTLLIQLADDLAYGIVALRIRRERDKVQRDLQKSYKKLERVLEETVDSLSSTVEKRDPYTSGHEHRVTTLACAIAHKLSVPKEIMECIRIAGLLHDIGKIAVPIEILSKPGKLTEPEFQIIQTHSRVGYDILKPIEFPWPVQQVVLQHHEKMNGSGYPDGILGKDILLASRILTVADVVEAITSHRPYRPAFDMNTALLEISNNKNILYDPEVVNACITLLTENGFKL